jgi:signal transduction histidine kinase
MAALERNDIPTWNRSEIKLPITPKALDRAERGLHTLETFTFKDRPAFRQISLPLLRNGQFSGDLVQVGASLGPTKSILKGTAILLWLLLPLVLIISVILAYILTAQALKPVVLMSQAASKLGVDDLSIRLVVPPAEDELQELSLTFNKMFDRLEDAVTRLRRFTADVSHELRTPLAVLRAEAELSLRKERSSEDYQTSLHSVHKEAKHMSVIIEDLLLLARVESSNLAFSWEPIKTSQFVEDLLGTVCTIFKERGIHIKLVLNGPEEFSCSKTYLSLALKNILLNACKHSASNSTVHFNILGGGDDFIEFVIKDEGEGISESDLPYIFDPFYRSDTARNRASGGVGIGLSLTLALIKLHKGKIDVHSKVGEGTCFSARIPIGSAACG